LGHQGLGTGLTRGGRALPVDGLADAPHTHGLTTQAYLPTRVSGRGLWPLGDRAEARAAALTQADQACPRVALDQEPSARVRGIRTDGFDSTTTSLRTLVPGARRGHCLRHARQKLPKNRVARASPVRQAFRAPCHPLWDRARQRKGWRGVALGQR
jgi:hypothetical protein